jgi:selenocysteine-specific elongation factor
MLAGVGGIDLVLLVIAADESIKPQTREHFDICRLLGISKGAVVVTKADLVEPDLVDLVKLEAEEFVAGSFLEGAPVVAVSSTTGAGLDELRTCLLELARSIPTKDASRHFRLPVDRAFSIHGFGTVVTGTLISGAVAREQEVELHPAGRTLRVRGVQVHGRAGERALAGQRTALNLAGVEPADIRRGMTLSAPGVFRPVTRIDCRLDLLASAKPLKHRAPVHFHTGTAEVEAEARLFDAGQPLRPGAASYVRLVLKEPLLILPGDRFIIRMFSPVVTIGGGLVVDIDPPRKGGTERLETLDRGSVAERVALLVRESPHGVSLPGLIARTGLPASELEPFATIRQPQTWFFDAAWADAKRAEIRKTLADFHRTNPLAAGMPKEALRAAVLADAPGFVLDALLPRDVVPEAETVRLASHKVVLKEDEERATGAMEAVFRDAGLAVPSLTEALSKSGLEPARARTLLQMLLRQGRLVKISEDLVFHRDALDSLRDRLAPHRGQKMTVLQFKDLAGISRKYAIPLLEYLDRTRLTRREGDARLVL